MNPIDYLVGLAAGLACGYWLTVWAIRLDWHPNPAPRTPRERSGATECAICGDTHTDRDPDTTVTLETLTAGVQVGIMHPSLQPSAAVILVPDTDRIVASTTVIHPDSFPDVTGLAKALDTVADRLRARQGQINFDSHQLRQAGDDQ